jgi:hypothetical protein
LGTILEAFHIFDPISIIPEIVYIPLRLAATLITSGFTRCPGGTATIRPPVRFERVLKMTGTEKLMRRIAYVGPAQAPRDSTTQLGTILEALHIIDPISIIPEVVYIPLRLTVALIIIRVGVEIEEGVAA